MQKFTRRRHTHLVSGLGPGEIHRHPLFLNRHVRKERNERAFGRTGERKPGLFRMVIKVRLCKGAVEPESDITFPENKSAANGCVVARHCLVEPKVRNRN